MYKKEEEKLAKFKEIYDQKQIPYDAIDKAILAGLKKAKSTPKPKKSKKWFISLVTTAALLMLFVGTVRASPAFAQYISSIPGMEKIVELIRGDKGKLSAIQNDYYQEIGATKESDGLKFTIDGAIADEEGIVLFYTIKGDNDDRVRLSNVNLKSAEGEILDFSSASYGSPDTSEKGSSGVIEFFFQSPYKSRNFILEYEINSNSKVNIPFTLKKDIKSGKVYYVNQEVEIEGQKITVLDVTINPLRTAVHVRFDPNNTKKILSFEDLRLIDERGETWGGIMNGTTASGISDNERIIYLQSNYFHNPSELSLVFDKIQAIDKKESYVLIDMKAEKILKQPRGKKIRNLQIKENELSVELYTNQPFNFDIFGSIKDKNGKELFSSSSYLHMYDPEKQMQKIGISIDGLKGLASPLSIQLSFFPEWIEGNAKIKIK